MTQHHLMIAVNWYGPYKDLDEAQKCAGYDYTHGLRRPQTPFAAHEDRLAVSALGEQRPPTE